MNKTLLTLATLTTLSFSYDSYIKPECSPLYEAGQEKLKIQAQLMEIGNDEVGTVSKDAYFYANEAKEDFNAISDAFLLCQADKPYKLNLADLDTFDRVENIKKRVEEIDHD